MPGLFEPMVIETCLCGAKFTGPNGGATEKSERREYRLMHAVCREAKAKALAEGLYAGAMSEEEIGAAQRGARERVGRELLEPDTVDLLADVTGFPARDAHAALQGIVGKLNLGPNPEASDAPLVDTEATQEMPLLGDETEGHP